VGFWLVKKLSALRYLTDQEHQIRGAREFYGDEVYKGKACFR